MEQTKRRKEHLRSEPQTEKRRARRSRATTAERSGREPRGMALDKVEQESTTGAVSGWLNALAREVAWYTLRRGRLRYGASAMARPPIEDRVSPTTRHSTPTHASHQHTRSLCRFWGGGPVLAVHDRSSCMSISMPAQVAAKGSLTSACSTQQAELVRHRCRRRGGAWHGAGSTTVRTKPSIHKGVNTMSPKVQRAGLCTACAHARRCADGQGGLQGDSSGGGATFLAEVDRSGTAK